MIGRLYLHERQQSIWLGLGWNRFLAWITLSTMDDD